MCCHIPTAVYSFVLPSPKGSGFPGHTERGREGQKDQGEVDKFQCFAKQLQVHVYVNVCPQLTQISHTEIKQHIVSLDFRDVKIYKYIYIYLQKIH